MKKMRFIALVLVVVMAAVLFASCTEQQPAEEQVAEKDVEEAVTEVVDEAAEEVAEAAEEAEPTEDRGYLLGFNSLLKGNYSIDIIEKAIVNAAEVYGCEVMVTDDGAQIENSIKNVDSMIAAGVDGIVFLGMSETLFPVVAEKCDAAGIPFVINDTWPSDEILEEIRGHESFVGGASVQNTVTGQVIGDAAVEDGATNAIVISGMNTDPTFVARTEKFTEALEAAGASVEVSYGEVTDAISRTNDMLTAHPDADCIYANNGQLASGTMEALAKHPEVDVKLYATDLDPDVLDALASGDIYAANGAHWINGIFAVALLVNALDGNALLDADGQAPLLNVKTMVLPSNLVDMYDRFWIQEQPYSDDEIATFVGTDVTVDYLQSVLDAYSVEERLQAKVDAGALTQEELDKALAG